MSTGQWVGGIVGAILGYLLAPYTFGISAVLGALYGAVIGYTIGGLIDPVKPDIKTPAAPKPQELQIITNRIGIPIYDILGTSKITGQLLFFGNERKVPIWYRPAKGKRAIRGYKYYCTWGLGICMGPVDTLYAIYRDNNADPIWKGMLERPASGGEATIQIEGVGTMVFYFGTDDQMPNPKVAPLLKEPTFNTGYRHLCWAFFDDCFMNEYNRMPSMTFVVRKQPNPLSVPAGIALYDINPSHALYYTLVEKAGLPESWLNKGVFESVANVLSAEKRGISLVYDAHQATLNYLEAINSHVDCILRYGSDGRFTPKLIRYDYNPATLPEINESMLLEEPAFSRRSWIDTINEVKVQYMEIVGERLVEPVNAYAHHLLREGGDLYLGGFRPEGNTGRLWFGLFNISSGGLVRWTDIHEQPGGIYNIVRHGDSFYLCGTIVYPGNNYKMYVMRIRASNFERVWHYEKDISMDYEYARGLAVIGDQVYWGGWRGGGGIVGRLTLDGNPVWEDITGFSGNGAIFDGGGNIVNFCGSVGGIIRLEKRQKNNGALLNTFSGTAQGYQLGFEKGGRYYTGGSTADIGPQRSCCIETNPETGITWYCSYNFHDQHTEYYINCVTDGSHIYAFGYIDHADAVLAKITFTGSNVWNIRLGKPGISAIAVDENYIYVGVYDLSAKQGFVQYRSKTDGSLVKECRI